MARHPVYAIDTVSVRTPGSKYPTLIRKGERWWSDHPIVKEHKDLFVVDDPTEVFPRGWNDTPDVEQATAAPGEKRDVVRPTPTTPNPGVPEKRPVGRSRKTNAG